MMIQGKSLIDTTVGRVLFNEFVPDKVKFVNELLTKKALQEMLLVMFRNMWCC